MTVKGAIAGAKQLLLGDSRARQEARYRLAMKVRRIDVSGATPEQLGLSEERSGVEISPALCTTAEANLKRAGVKNASVYCCDAGEFRRLDAYAFVYMDNPFPEAIMQRVSANLRLSIARFPRDLVLIYKNPLYERSIISAGFRRIMRFDQFRLPVGIYAL